MNSFFERFIAAILSLFLITYSGYQAYRYFYTKYKTETTYSYTVADTIKTRGIMVRDEEIIKDNPKGIVDYLHDDGTKISEGSAIAEIYKSEADVKNQKRVREIEEEIIMLENAQNQALTQTLQADILNRQINEQVGILVDISETSMVSSIDSAENQLSMLLNKKQIATGKIDNLYGRIDSLKNQKNYYSNEINSNYEPIISPYSGYFVRNIDEFETIINTDNMFDISIKEYQNLLYLEPEVEQDGLGKIVLSHNWYLAVPVDKEQISKFNLGKTVSLDFEVDNLHDVPATVYDIITEEFNDTSIVFLKCNYIVPEIISMRATDVKISFKSYTGLKVSTSAIRFKDNKKGVFIKQGHEIRFKEIEAIYEEPGFILCGVSANSNSGLKLFDEVIVEGTELYDGKGIK